MALPVDRVTLSGPSAGGSRTDSSNRAGAGFAPPPAPLRMPIQKLDRWKGPSPRKADRGPDLRTLLARLIVFGGGAAVAAAGTYEMYLVVAVGQTTVLEWVLVFLFALTFSWIAVAATAAVASLLLPAPRFSSTAPITRRTALVMPVYNEEPARTVARLAAMAEELVARDAAGHFEIFVISDTTDPDVWVAEVRAVAALRRATEGRIAVWYRRRTKNTAKKAGNVQDFVTRWGGRYDHMVILDADSLMSADTLLTLARAMEADPRSGIIQTVPVLAGGTSLFARMQQFAGRVYGPVVARGMSLWQGRDGNYWGHNAIIRVPAFAASAGLPELRGRKPFGGPILSHDFVEAALIRRAGYAVTMLPDLSGSWEESPPALIDVAVRDRRWAQGNLQHLNVIGAKGLAWPNRVHFAIGILSYLASPLWLIFMLTGLALALQAHFIRPEYFRGDFSLFPEWPRFDTERMIALFVASMFVLLLPKMIGLIQALFRRDLRMGLSGLILLPAGLIVETLLSALVAPVMMMMQTHHVISILTGRDSGWGVQRRDGGALPLSTLIRVHWGHTLFGLVLGGSAWVISPAIFLWMSPTLAGLLLAIPISGLSGSVFFGRLLYRLGLLRIPEETRPPSLMTRATDYRRELEAELGRAGDGLVRVARDPEVRAVHLAALLDPPHVRGYPDPSAATAEIKVREAERFVQLLVWLDRRERVAILQSRTLIAAVTALAAGERPRPASERS